MGASKASGSPPPTDNNEDDTHLQACFVLRRASAKATANAGSSKSRRRIDFECECKGNLQGKSLHSLPPHFENEHPLYGKWRMEAFTCTWSHMENTIQDVLLELNTRTFEEIHRWIHNSFFADLQSKLYLSFESKSSNACLCSPVVKQLATALVFIRNVEFVDDQSTFKELGSYLKSHNCHVANLTPQDFSFKSGIGGCVRSLLRQTVMISPDTPDIEILASWHHESANREYPVAIIIEDVERCNCSVLAEFIIMLSEWVVQVPIVIVMGMATTVDALRKILPSSAIQHLHPQRFTLKYPLERLEAVVSGVLIASFYGFDIGHNVAKFLYNLFLRQDGTVTSFLRALKIACMEHFCREPLSFLCKELTQNASQEVLESTCKALPRVMLKYVANIPSVKRESEDEDEQIGKKLAASLLDIKKRRQDWSTVLMCLCEAGKHAKVRLVDIFCEALSPLSTSILNSLGKKIEGGRTSTTHTFTNDDLHNNQCLDSRREKFIDHVIRKIRDLPLSSLSSLLTEWEKLTKEMREINVEIHLLQSMIGPEYNMDKPEGNSIGSRRDCELRRDRLLPSTEGGLNNVSDSVTIISQDFSRDLTSTTWSSKTCKDSHLQKFGSHGYPSIEKEDPKAASEMTMKLLEHMVREYLIPMESMPFHEILCFKDVNSLQLALMGDTRKIIQNDLLNSQSSLNCNCCRGLVGLSSSMHDTSLVYNLAQEHGDVINVHDWYQSFAAIVSKADVENECVEKQALSLKKRKTINGSPQAYKASIQARFCKAITELQIAGLLRMPNKRRPDYVQRIAFGL